jgi:hypothetical protein
VAHVGRMGGLRNEEGRRRGGVGALYWLHGREYWEGMIMSGSFVSIGGGRDLVLGTLWECVLTPLMMRSGESLEVGLCPMG